MWVQTEHDKPVRMRRGQSHSKREEPLLLQRMEMRDTSKNKKEREESSTHQDDQIGSCQKRDTVRTRW